MNHFTDIEIDRWAREGPGPDSERLRQHLAECADCARRYARAATDVDDSIPDASPKKPPEWMIPVIAAALAAIVFATPFLLRHHETRTQLQLHGAAIETFTKGANLEWTRVAGGARYRVDVFRGTQRVYTAVTDKTQLPKPQLDPGDYEWTVTVLDAHAREIASSPRRALAITG